jgi:CDP-paratose 2-epimerase
MIEAIRMTEEMTGRKMNYQLSEQSRSGDHIWWISDVRKFQNDYPRWSYKYDQRSILQAIVDATAERNQSPAR